MRHRRYSRTRQRRQAECPLCSTPVSGEGVSSGRHCTDRSPDADRAVESAAELAARDDAGLLALQVITSESLVGTADAVSVGGPDRSARPDETIAAEPPPGQLLARTAAIGRILLRHGVRELRLGRSKRRAPGAGAELP